MTVAVKQVLNQILSDAVQTHNKKQQVYATVKRCYAHTF